MGEITLLILIGAVSLIVGGAIGYFILKSSSRKHEVEAREKADLIIKEAKINAETIKKDKILEAKSIVSDAVASNGLTALPSSTNFMFVNLGTGDAEIFRQKMAEQILAKMHPSCRYATNMQRV